MADGTNDTILDPTDGKSEENNGGSGTPGSEGGNEEMLSKEQVNKIVQERLARERKQYQQKLQKEKEKLAQEFERMRSMTEEEKAALQQKLQEFEEKFMSEKELAEKRAREMEEKRKREVEEFKKEAERNRELLVKHMKEAHLSQLAAKYDAFDPQQVVDLLSGRVVVEEEVSPVTKRPTGKFRLTVRVPVANEDGSVEEQELSLEEGVKAYLDSHPNLLKSNVVSGGSGSMPGTIDTDGRRTISPSDIEKMAPEEVEKLLEDFGAGRINIPQPY